MKPAIKILFLILGNFLLLAFALPSCKEREQAATSVDTKAEERAIIATLDSFNRAAARADFDRYFGFYTDDAIFAGTDATERWDLPAFKVWSKPYFDRGKAWDFTAIERHIYFDKTGSLAWFDELLNTQMKICRGSGVLVKKGNDWKVAQYILSATVPNPVLDSVITMKAPVEDSLINSLLKK
ncbi:nuclear transport factor 2 family protein [Terrimonas sp. NA20]|uniref:Nuclear transport factor 2 family protein n=1 Tax=Terrimonas ginsenosidimutans TaxID=2908004 RepID=A0ABS9KWP4_9BACT|nr:nuclear transport factor 2 family protein [Terrimonas ginsenosidimutans]MCG2616736.1 nuclear transport factor 2 family protein [Terrimonas ginsenosidimutans]